MRYCLLFIVTLLAFAPRAQADETCRIALVLALDVSGSVNAAEYRQQLDGLAFALGSAEVRALILGGAPVQLAVFEWSSRNHQFLVQPWVTLDSEAAIDRAVARIRGYRKQRAGLKTALSTAMLFAAELLRLAPCWEKKIDVSGDGRNNIGPPLAQVYALDVFADITVNALAVTVEDSADGGALQRYFEREVIRGPGAFAMVAQGYEDYARAMERKLIRELSVPVFGYASP